MKPWTLALTLAVAPVLGCVDRLADPDEEPRYPACAKITASGYWEDGTQYVLVDERDGATGSACICLTEQEKKSGDWDEEINDLAFAECTRLADVYSGNFDWDDCEEGYRSGEWIKSIAFAIDDTAWRARGLECSGDSEGCSTSSERAPGALCASALIGLLWLRRRRPRRRLCLFSPSSASHSQPCPIPRTQSADLQSIQIPPCPESSSAVAQ